jgi:hypothetical protein
VQIRCLATDGATSPPVLFPTVAEVAVSAVPLILMSGEAVPSFDLLSSGETVRRLF